MDEKIELKKDSYLNLITDNKLCEIITNKDRFATINFLKLKIDIKNKRYQFNSLNFEKDEYINNIYFIDNLINGISGIEKKYDSYN